LPLLLVLASAAAPFAAGSRSLATSDDDGDKEAWTGEGLFLPANLTERDVFVDGLGGRDGEKDDLQPSGGSSTDGGDDENDDGTLRRDAGAFGRIFEALLRRSRAQERATPNVGGSAGAFTRVEGARTAQRRNATVTLSSGALNAAALGTAGAAAVAPAGELARADARAGASTFANAILSDKNRDPKDFSSAGSSRGSTVAVGGPVPPPSPGNGTGAPAGARAAGAQTVLGTASAAGEQAAQGRAGLGIGPFLVLFNLGTRDGGQQSGGAGSTGIGDKASTRLQVATLAEGRKSDEEVRLDKVPDKEKEEKDEDQDGGGSKKESEGGGGGDEGEGASAGQAGQAGLRSSADKAPPPPPPKPPGPYARHTAKKRDELAAKRAREAEREANEPKKPEDAAIATGELSGGCAFETGDGGGGKEEGSGETDGGGGEDGSDDKCDHRHGYRGGSALRAWADSADDPGLSTTGAGIADVNVRAGLTSEGAANRYGYSRGISTGSAGATATRAARARVASASFGTGYVVKSTSATARTVERAEGGDDGKDKGGEGDGEDDRGREKDAGDG